MPAIKRRTLGRREFLKRAVLGAVGGMAELRGISYTRLGKGPQPNVLLIITDDLRPQLGCYGQNQMATPHIDRLASGGLVFDRSYCQQALCAPSRASLLSGLRPESTGVHDLKTSLSETLPRHVSLPKHFRRYGYETVSVGKVFHNPADNIDSWSREPFTVNEKIYATPQNQAQEPFASPVEAADVPDQQYRDGIVCERAIAELRRLKDRPFFLAVGFSKPHLPFAVPRKYWNLYDPKKIALPENIRPPAGIPDFSLGVSGEIRSYRDVPRGDTPLPPDLARRLIHGYYACVSFLDAQVGRVLDELDRLGLREKTVIVLWGDNGWKLGERGGWGKNTLSELDLRVPLIVDAPGMKTAGKHSRALVEAVDLYPSLCEWCDLPLPRQSMEGLSLAPLLENPERKWKQAAFGQCVRHLGGGSPLIKYMGYSLRTERYRYNQWIQKSDGTVVGRELYDLERDPGENVSLVNDPSHASLVRELETLMRDGWREGQRDF